MNQIVGSDLRETEDITRDFQIIYSVHVDPKDVEFVLVATDILTKVSKHFTGKHVNVKLVRGGGCTFNACKKKLT